MRTEITVICILLISSYCSALLKKGSVYIALLQEELFLPDFISGRANPKSSTGRLDIFTRLITDYAAKFEDVRAGL